MAARNVPSGYERGNGGQFVQCTSASSYGEGVFSLDRIEGSALFNLKPAAKHYLYQHEDQIVDALLQDLSQIDKRRAAQYREWLKELKANREFVDDLYFQPIADGNTVAVPYNCNVIQGAIFITNSVQSKVRFLFSGKHWNNASALDRAFLLIHELVYREARLIENNHLNSMASRYVVAWLFAHAGNFRAEEFLDILQRTHFRIGEYQGMPIVLNSMLVNGEHIQAPLLRFPNSDRIKKAVVGEVFDIKIGDQIFHRNCPSSIRSAGFVSSIEYFPSGKVKKLILDPEFAYGEPPYTPFEGNVVCTFNGYNVIEFDEQGHPILLEKALWIDRFSEFEE